MSLKNIFSFLGTKFKDRYFVTLFVLIVVYLFFASASIFRITEYWSITNELFWARDLALATAVSTVLSLMISEYSIKLSAVIFVLTFFMEIFGNVFYSYHWLITNQAIQGEASFFIYWCDMNKWMYEMMMGDTDNIVYHEHMKIITVWLQGSFAPMMQGITFFSIQKIQKIKRSQTQSLIVAPQQLDETPEVELNLENDPVLEPDVAPEVDKDLDNNPVFEPDKIISEPDETQPEIPLDQSIVEPPIETRDEQMEPNDMEDQDLIEFLNTANDEEVKKKKMKPH
jgi:hypothetical protein